MKNEPNKTTVETLAVTMVNDDMLTEFDSQVQEDDLTLSVHLAVSLDFYISYQGEFRVTDAHGCECIHREDAMNLFMFDEPCGCDLSELESLAAWAKALHERTLQAIEEWKTVTPVCETCEGWHDNGACPES